MIEPTNQATSQSSAFSLTQSYYARAYRYLSPFPTHGEAKMRPVPASFDQLQGCALIRIVNGREAGGLYKPHFTQFGYS
jgi:hypothetical protein